MLHLIKPSDHVWPKNDHNTNASGKRCNGRSCQMSVFDCCCSHVQCNGKTTKPRNYRHTEVRTFIFLIYLLVLINKNHYHLYKKMGCFECLENWPLGHWHNALSSANHVLDQITATCHALVAAYGGLPDPSDSWVSCCKKNRNFSDRK